MFENKEVAAEISKLMLDIGARLDQSLELVQAKEGAEAFERYRAVVATIMGEMLLEVMNPLYGKHPELKPAELS